MDRAEDRFRISSFWGEFRNQAEEAAFREYMQSDMVRHMRVALTVWGSLLLLFGLVDYQGLGLSSVFMTLMGARIALSLAIFIYGYVLLRKPKLATSGGVTMALQLVGFLFFYLLYFLRPEIATFTVFVLGLLFISMFVFVPNRLYFSAIAAVLGLAGLMVCMIVMERPGNVIFGAFVLLTLPILVGFFATQRLQIAQRQQYAMYTHANEVNQELQAEIERRKVLEKELNRQATTDPLTGLFNRRQYEMLFDRERERSKRNGSHLSLCVADIDFFKRVNDEHGHDAGDQVLKHVADQFSHALRQSDIIGRFGGEEFILLLPDTGLEDAEVVINRLRQRLEAAPVSVGDDQIGVTATFGLTEVCTSDNSIEDVIRRADKALYEGKAGGRNCVVPVPC
ncbi:diguanylate cyclase [Pseudomonas sp. gcc21]|uniref:GGDEF domain-containing protein n=1 Tax=Pseudomonas sp. gcc21 TaxID=2726989 RepID=UPI0014529BD0|nr:GGDEF domain-containing protein [Pseudomonas sp. gcc21]QJD60616.1 diguanylate cyclase [Pseudomonas sp. gcc21]